MAIACDTQTLAAGMVPYSMPSLVVGYLGEASVTMTPQQAKNIRFQERTGLLPDLADEMLRKLAANLNGLPMTVY